MRVESGVQAPFPAGKEVVMHNSETQKASAKDRPRPPEPVQALTQHAIEAMEQTERDEKAMHDRISKAVQALNEMIFDRQLQFEKHEATGRIMVRVVDTSTNEVVREIPPRKILDMIGQMLQGLLVDERA